MENSNYGEEREYWKTMKTGLGDLKEDRDSQETMVLYGPVWV